MQTLKKIITTVAIILTILAYNITIAVTKNKGTVATETLRLRKEASLNSTVLELLYKNDEVEIIAEEGNWYKVKFKDYTGFVSKEYITKDKNTEISASNNNDEESNNSENSKIEETDNNETTINDKTNQIEDVKVDEANEAENNDNTNQELINKEVTVNNDINVYILPLINSNIIGNLKQNTKVNIINATGVWVYINTDNIAGWIKLDQINTNNNTQINNEEKNNEENSNDNQEKNSQTGAEQNTNNNETKEYTAKNLYVKSSSINVRTKPTTSSDVVTTLIQNAQVKAIGEESDWYKVEVNGKTGYILKTLLSDKKVEVTSRSATPERETTSQKSNDTKTKTQEAEATNYNASKGEQVVAYAKNYLGCKYVYAGSGPKVFDCSGFTMYVYKHFGYSMGHSAVTQARLGKYVSKDNLKPGDLVIFNNSANTSIGHVGIYVGGGNFIHASSGGGKVMISSLSNSYYKARYVTGRRVI